MAIQEDIRNWGNNNLGFGMPKNLNNQPQQKEEKRLSMNALLDNSPKYFYCRKCHKIDIIDDWEFALRFSVPGENIDEPILRSILERLSFNINLMCKCSECGDPMTICNERTIIPFSKLEEKGYFIANFNDGNEDNINKPGYINFLPGIVLPDGIEYPDWSIVESDKDHPTSLVVDWTGREDFGFATGFPMFKNRYMENLIKIIESLPRCKSTIGYNNANEYIASNAIERR